MPEPFIQINLLSKSNETPAGPLCVLSGIDMQLKRGDLVTLFEPSGGGKTTLINMITGVDKPTSGTVMVDGVDMANTSERKLTRWRGRTIALFFSSSSSCPRSPCWRT